MVSLLKWLFASYLVGMVATSYIVVRLSGFSKVNGSQQSASMVLAFDQLGLVLMSMMLTFGWGGIGLVVHYIGGDLQLYTKFSVALAGLLILLLRTSNIHDKSDKMILTAIVIVGTGLALPTLLTM